jgi:hypothetical protein
MENVMAAKIDSSRNPKRARVTQSDAIRDGGNFIERAAGKGRIKPKIGKLAERNVVGRMPERSEAISGDEADGLTPISAAIGRSGAKVKSVPKSVGRAQIIRSSATRP